MSYPSRYPVRRSKPQRRARPSRPRLSVRSFLLMRSAIRAATFWVPQTPPAERPADPLATRVLKNGSAIVAPPGRADDFSWPRADTKDGDAADVAPVQVTPPPTVRPATTVRKTKIKTTPTRPRQTRINLRDSRSCSRLRTNSRPPSRSVPATERPVGRPYRSAPLFQIRGEERFPIGIP